MAILCEEMHVITDSEDGGRLSPERDVNQLVLLGDHGRPRGEGIGDQERWRIGRRRRDQLADEVRDDQREVIEEGLPELDDVEVAVEVEGEAVGDGGVAHVEARGARLGKDVGAVGGGEYLVAGVLGED